MNTSRTPARRFYCYPASNQVEGPFELVELAGLLRGNHITGETLVMIEGEEEWLPFEKRNEFHLAREIPQDAIKRHFEEHAEATASPFSWAKLKVFLWIMLPFFGYLAFRIFRIYLYSAGHTADSSALDGADGSN